MATDPSAQAGLSGDGAFVDGVALRDSAYADHGPLAARIGIYAWQRNRLDLPGLAVDALTDVTGVVLDAGCGTGANTVRLRRDRPDLRVVPLDLSFGMTPEVAGDLQALPLADDCVDGALAMHVLYHVPDIAAAARELRRVLRPGGTLVVTTNAHGDKRELDELWTQVIADLSGQDVAPPAGDERFGTGPADIGVLRSAFVDVVLTEHVRETVVPEAGPVVAYVDSMRGFDADALPAGLDWDVFVDAARARVEEEISRTGAWRMTNQVGVFVCR